MSDDESEILPAYWKWREAGMNNPVFVRYPVGATSARSTCAYSLEESTNDKLGYVEARKRIYAKLYKKLVRKSKLYHELLGMLKKGVNLLIVEVDGPRQKDLPYYMSKYGVDDKWIDNNTILATQANLDIMVNDVKNPYGHGYCLAEALLEDK